MGYVRCITPITHMKVQQARSRRRENTHITIVIEGNQEDFDSLRKEIARTIAKHNHTSERKASYVVLRTTPMS